MIVDKFIFCTALGKSGKEAILNLEKKKRESVCWGCWCDWQPLE
jgi:hypothetical protein